MTSESKPIRLGDMLLDAGLLSEQDLHEAAQLAIEISLPLGKVLVMSGFIGEVLLQKVIQAQSMVKDQLITMSMARDAIKVVANEGIPLDVALVRLGFVPHETQTTNKLGELLLDSGIVSYEQINDALKSTADTGLPLGRVLVLTGHLKEEILWAALNAQVLIRDGKITRQQAIAGLKSALRRHLSIEQALDEHGILRPGSHNKIKLGELLVMSSVLKESDIMDALELGILHNKPLGQVLTEKKLINKDTLASALRLQEMVDNGTLSPVGSAEVLKQIHINGLSIVQAVAELGLLPQRSHETVRLGELLKLAGLITEPDIQEALRLSLKNSSLVGKILLISGLIDEHTLHAALRCQFLLREGFLKQEQAIIALHYCQRLQCSLDDALDELGWTVSTRRRLDPELGMIGNVNQDNSGSRPN
jgi:hypothetical protein